MNNKKNANSMLLVEILVGTVWLIAMLLFVDFENAESVIWESIAFGFAAFVGCGFVIAYFAKRARSELVEVAFTPITSTWIYLSAMMLFNGFPVLFAYYTGGNMLQYGLFELNLSVSLTINLILTAVYAASVIMSGRYYAMVSSNLEESSGRTNNCKIISTKLSVIINECKDKDVQEKLKEFKEKVDYSSNVTSNKAKETEERLILKLDVISNLLRTNAEKEALFSEVEELICLWKNRNSI